MTRNMLCFGAVMVVLFAFAGASHAADFNSLADQSSYRCSGGIVSVGDLDRDVREKCGDPLEIARIQGWSNGYIKRSPNNDKNAVRQPLCITWHF